jgi:type VI secretion system secreted protein VgrG
VKTPLGPDVLRLTGFTGREAISQLFELRLDMIAAATSAVAFDQLLGQSITIALDLPGGTQRYFSGMAAGVTKGATSTVGGSDQITQYRMLVVPKLWLLTRRRQSRIFQQKSVTDILKSVLTGLDVSYQLTGNYLPRDYCAQYRETDFEFASRLMEEEGIYYFFKHADGAHTMVVADSPVAHPPLPEETLIFKPATGGLTEYDRVTTWEKSQEITSGKFTLWDSSFELPGRNLEATTTVKPESVQVGTVSHKLQVASNNALEIYDFPGGYAGRFDGSAPGGSERASDVQHIFEDNMRTVNIRMGQDASTGIVVRAGSTCRELVSGHKFTLDGHQDADGSYVLVSVEHTARTGSADSTNGNEDEFTYTNTFTCVPAALPYRPPRVTPRPFVHGCQTAVVVGPAGEEIFTDRYGRVKVQFPWDREGKKDANSACWVRVASFWAGRKWGAVHIPRIGQEVIVDFEEGDPDQPIIVGSVYNAENMPPYELPANKTQSGVKSRSTPQGTDETFNEIRLEDKKDAEQIFVQAQKDLDTKVKNNETRAVWNDRTTVISNNDTRTVGGPDKDGNAIGGNDTITIKKGNRTITIDEGNLSTTVSKGDETREITTGKQTITVKGNVTVTVQQGNHETTVSTGNGKVDISAGKYEVSAAQEIMLKVGPSHIKITPTSIELSAPTGIELKVGATKIALGVAQLEAVSVQTKVEGQAQVEVKGGAMAKISGGALLQAQGGIVMIN